ncbi:11785_t:CDS:2 [Ambispora leptoticha]|uniref:11785_t:CDS:1 n=1 Tax=Ambispora leptoticha TaxID=144679 RepID=A0A9N9HA22_9GLOM|nr:11785_t:CDS:2 [Ambispora leptoticha]
MTSIFIEPKTVTIIADVVRLQLAVSMEQTWFLMITPFNALKVPNVCTYIFDLPPFSTEDVTEDPLKTIFVGRLNPDTSEETLQKVFEKFGAIKKIRLVRNLVTGDSRGYAFIEFTHERSSQDAYRNANKMTVDDRQILVDYERSRLMEGWIPRRLGGGFGGKKESGQLRFGARDRPFKRPLHIAGNQAMPDILPEQRYDDCWRRYHLQVSSPTSYDRQVQDRRISSTTAVTATSFHHSPRSSVFQYQNDGTSTSLERWNNSPYDSRNSAKHTSRSPPRRNLLSSHHHHRLDNVQSDTRLKDEYIQSDARTKKNDEKVYRRHYSRSRSQNPSPNRRERDYNKKRYRERDKEEGGEHKDRRKINHG